MHKPEFVWENETYKKTLWYFETQTDYLIPARRPDLLIIDKKKKKKKKKRKNLLKSGFCYPGELRIDDADCNWCASNVPPKLVRGIEQLEIWRAEDQ